jgi:hypothetical protein
MKLSQVIPWGRSSESLARPVSFRSWPSTASGPHTAAPSLST